MAWVCEICGKKPVKGNRITRSGLAKAKGGVGLHTGGITRRRFRPNLQKLRVEIDGTVRRMRICVRCWKAGKVRRPMARPKPTPKTEG